MIKQFIVRLPDGRLFQVSPPEFTPTEADAAKWAKDQLKLDYDVTYVHRIMEMFSSGIEELFPAKPPVKP